MALTRLFFDSDSDFDRMLSTRLGPALNPMMGNAMMSQAMGGRILPKFDIIQKDENVCVMAELPGVRKEDIKIDLVADRLTISGSMKEEKEYTDEASVTHRERTFGSFSRSLQVPHGVKANEIKASMDHGILRVTLPAKPKGPPSHEIPVH